MTHSEQEMLDEAARLTGFATNERDRSASMIRQGAALLQENKALREWLWLNHGCPICVLYGDDWERQCNNFSRHRYLDFKRDSIFDILREVMYKPISSPDDKWYQAIDEASVSWELAVNPTDDPKMALHNLITAEVQAALDPAVSADARELQAIPHERWNTLKEEIDVCIKHAIIMRNKFSGSTSHDDLVMYDIIDAEVKAFQACLGMMATLERKELNL